jgi:hypothetical protein
VVGLVTKTGIRLYREREQISFNTRGVKKHVLVGIARCYYLYKL